MPQHIRIFCREDINLSVAVRGSTVVLARTNPADESQHWVQEFSGSGMVTDDEGQRAFALVNKATGLALVNKNLITPSDNVVHVQLAPYFGDVRVDLSMLWTLGAADLGGGFREVRVLRDTTQTLNGLGGNVRDGTVVGIFPSHQQSPNAVWNLAPVHVSDAE
ncbi:hypothetical protein PAHAL_7G186800 [Panicum hallii]|jgi:hypothetical protein|uniref:Uncharacterized protein n=1 Tax=Panicum hallii TaxID=206008 RepID=A0A2S3I7N3_9POAL|nr:ricin B-like lectin R40C1 [Panicum hallii]PAN38647.1 hypothetical protein PAHAL_7G186800 [Panicum hallii]